MVNCWMQLNELKLKVVSIIPETAEASTYILEPVGQETVVYEAGQFLTFLFTIQGKAVRRSYSLSSVAGIDEHLHITVKRVSNGLVSRFLVDHVHVGDVLTALQPTGRFTIANNEQPICFIAAGSGITPAYALIRYVLHFHPAQRVVLIYQSTNEASAIFRQQLLLLQEGFSDRLSIEWLFSQPTNSFHPPRRLNNYLLEALLKTYHLLPQAEYFICGPASFMLVAEVTLRLMGVPSSQLKKEQFDLPEPPKPPLHVDAARRQVTVLHKGHSYRFHVTYPQNILQAALAQQVQLPYSCRGGRCSACTIKCTSGSVVMAKNEVLTEKDIAQGLVLTCVGYAASDLVLELQ